MNSQQCPKCLHVYPAPTGGVASVTCGGCGFVNCLTEQAQRQSLEGYYADKAATLRAAMEDAERMGRTVQYLDREGVELEWRNKRGVTQAEERRKNVEWEAGESWKP